jgi:pimeloyl-ACP methyl ester carboxylesterase
VSPALTQLVDTPLPDDPNSVDEANLHPEVFAHKTVGQVADHFEQVIGKLERKPVLIGHSFGGLLAQILAGREPTTAVRSRSPTSSSVTRSRMRSALSVRVQESWVSSITLSSKS